jgi:uncharacterized membrane protein
MPKPLKKHLKKGENMYAIKWKKEMPMLIILSALFIASAFLYPRLPDKIPMHWNIRGQVDSYAAKSMVTVLLFPFITLCLYAITLFLPFIDPRKNRYIQFEKAYYISRFALIAFFAVVWTALMSASIGLNVSIGKIIPGCVAVLLMVLGNYMGKVRRNWFFGIRLPWTLSSEENWNKTHRLGGKLFVISGVVGLLSCGLKPQWTFGILLGAIAIAVIATTVFSYRLFSRKNPVAKTSDEK